MKSLPSRFQAFSLIELSIVVLIIGILIAGVTAGSKLVSKSRLKTAQALTQSSPAHSISGLIAWWETTMENSVTSASNSSNPEDDDLISSLNDINLQSTSTTNATQATSGNRPIYKANKMNGLPVIRFNNGSNGTTNYMDFNGSILANTDYTIFVVEQRSNSNVQNYFLAGSGSANNSNLVLGYKTDTVISHDQYGNGYNMSPVIAGYNGKIPRIHTFRQSSALGKNYYLNGNNSLFPTTNSKNDTTQLSSYNGATIGRFVIVNYYQGDIAEIIMFARALKTEERQSIEDYLGKKWGIIVAH
jgi:prepilin-type N-terminal cleavage/methylation domain-containing protein